MIQTTKWSPDTCDCVILLKWDDAVGQEERTHTHGGTITKCDAHSQTLDKDLLEELLGENQNKNRVLGKAMEVMGINRENLEEVKAIEYTFDANRKLEVVVKGITPTKRVELENAISEDPLIDKSRGGLKTEGVKK